MATLRSGAGVPVGLRATGNPGGPVGPRLRAMILRISEEISSGAAKSSSSGAFRLPPGTEFVHTLGDAHLYLNHLEQARRTRISRPRWRCEPAANADPPVFRTFSLRSFLVQMVV